MADDVDALYELPLEDFTGARNELAKQLRARGDKQAAAEVAKLKKPSAPVWAINQTARAHNAAVKRLLGAGDDLRDAQRALFKGGEPKKMREAGAAERTAIAELVEHAARALEDGGHTATAAFRERIADTLSAIAVDPDLHDELLAGRVTEEHRRVGFGEVPDLKLVPPLPKGKTKAAERAKEEQDRAKQRKKEAEARAQRLIAEATDLDEEADELEAKAKRARRKAKTLREQADAALRTH